jgi:hypothetical protein
MLVDCQIILTFFLNFYKSVWKEIIKNINGVMLNAYPDSIGEKFSDTVAMLQMPEFKDVFLCYTFCLLFLIAT